MCNTVSVMPKVIYILRIRRLRLLASMLVILAILCNSVAMAQAYSIPVMQDCCPEMTVDKMDSPEMAGQSNSCPSTSSDCDDLCMARCLNANGLLSVALTILPNVLIKPALPQFSVAEHSTANFSPSLRPPIYS